MNTKAYITFLNKALAIERHIQLSDLAINNLRNIYESKVKIDNIQLNEIAGKKDKSKYDKLQLPIKDYKKITSFSKQQNIVYGFTYLYELYVTYLTSLTDYLINRDLELSYSLIERLNLKAINIDIKEVLEIYQLKKKDIELSIKNKILSLIRKKFENKNGKDFIKAAIHIFDIEVDSEYNSKIRCYIDVRHSFIHNDGFTNQNFKNKYSGLIGLKESGRKKNSDNKYKIATEYQFLNEALNCYKTTTKLIDDQFYAKYIKQAPPKQG